MMELDDELSEHLAAVTGTVVERSDVILDISERLSSCFRAGGKLMVCGNGGSAADAQHFAAEFVNRFRHDRKALPAMALSTDTSTLTSIANDFSYDDVFARQVEAHGRPGDVLIALSTSGMSRNVLAALGAARQQGVVTIGFTGRVGADLMRPLCDVLLAVPSTETARIQECHGFVLHVIARRVEEDLLDTG